MTFRGAASLLLFLACLGAAWLGTVATPLVARAAEAAAAGSAAPTGAPAAAPVPVPGPSRVLYPPERIPLHFDHARHASKGGLTCLYCHSGAASSRKTADGLLPPPSRCDACHGTNHDELVSVRPGVGPAKDCAFCHAGHAAEDGNRVARVTMPDSFVRSDHAAHVARGIPCARCHAGVASAALATRANLPSMKTCLECHRAGGTARDACDVCHLAKSGVLVTHFPTGSLVPPAWMHGIEHGPDWILRHRAAAGADSALCGTCHSEKECVDCHDGRVRPRTVHPNDWLSLHPVAARANDPVCTSCHREQSFCLSCHQRVGVALSSPYGLEGERGRFHPPKAVWTDLPRTSQHHAWEAQRNLSACVSCHTERDCTLCHATAGRGGVGGLSPHPAGFRMDCRAALQKNARPCLFCHDTTDQSLTECR